METLTFTNADTAALADDGPQIHEFRAMGSQMMAALDGSAAPTEALLAQVPGWFAGWEQQLSRFRPDSELSRLNARAGEVVAVSAELWAVLQLALAAADDTGGLVTPAVLNALEAAGYDRTFDLVRVSQPRDIAGGPTPVPVPDWRAIHLDPRRRLVLLPRGMRLDFGGIAKGWAADQAAARLGCWRPALIEAGGDIAVSGPLADGSAWLVGVADPTAPDQQLARLRIRGGGVATSGRDYHRWRQDGAEAHHIIDPRTGAPAVTDVLSATVVAASAVQAEVAAKTVLILGSRAGLRWLDSQGGLAALVVLDTGHTRASRGWAQYVWE